MFRASHEQEPSHSLQSLKSRLLTSSAWYRMTARSQIAVKTNNLSQMKFFSKKLYYFPDMYANQKQQFPPTCDSDWAALWSTVESHQLRSRHHRASSRTTGRKGWVEEAAAGHLLWSRCRPAACWRSVRADSFLQGTKIHFSLFACFHRCVYVFWSFRSKVFCVPNFTKKTCMSPLWQRHKYACRKNEKVKAKLLC